MSRETNSRGNERLRHLYDVVGVAL